MRSGRVEVRWNVGFRLLVLEAHPEENRTKGTCEEEQINGSEDEHRIRQKGQVPIIQREMSTSDDESADRRMTGNIISLIERTLTHAQIGAGMPGLKRTHHQLQ